MSHLVRLPCKPCVNTRAKLSKYLRFIALDDRSQYQGHLVQRTWDLPLRRRRICANIPDLARVSETATLFCNECAIAGFCNEAEGRVNRCKQLPPNQIPKVRITNKWRRSQSTPTPTPLLQRSCVKKLRLPENHVI